MLLQSQGTAISVASPKAETDEQLVFKRRTPRTYLQSITQALYPRGGWSRAVQYIGHRIRRLPDPAHKISRGIAVGVFTCFTPFFGMHFFIAAWLAWLVRGNVMAALLATFFGNPLTFPFIVAVSMELGAFLMGRPPIPLQDVVPAFSDAALEMWQNMMAMFTADQTAWGSLRGFFDRYFLPYLIGGLIPGFLFGTAGYFLSNPVLNAYQKARVARLKKKFAKKREKAEARRAESRMQGDVEDPHDRAAE
ncbi:DUF2062 domain-containing protein [Boseongicola aestuarii]|uniref:DUF2062 domain-containing protein n=1 Tax=Boseongicola aestuarii TaxID=1470561 RepID=A0A238J453_9RHOB|nr:DUF2062 domain-containing protein [Boseongicola aestuarii]SMX25113.1 hypothetical protein BOA8489_03247 [Boseongicola aestuarii]